MIAVDTNVLARYLLNDDFEQAKAAARLLSGRELIDIPLSVWLELVWVLQINDCGNPEIIKGLRTSSDCRASGRAPSMSFFMLCAGTRKAWTSATRCISP